MKTLEELYKIWVNLRNSYTSLAELDLESLDARLIETRLQDSLASSLAAVEMLILKLKTLSNSDKRSQI